MARSLPAQLLAALVAVALAGHVALASPASEPLYPKDPDNVLQKSTPARFVMGVKFGGGGSLWDEPDSTVLRTFQTAPRAGERFDLPIFDETRGGFVLSSGFFMQGIFYDYFGLEVGLHFVKHKLLEDIDWSFVESITVNGQTTVNTFEAKSEQHLQWTALHLPILVKAIVPSGTTRLSLGVGPEFSFGSWSTTRFKITEGGVTGEACGGTTDNAVRLPGSRCAFQDVKARLEDSVYLTVVFGIEIVAGDFTIPIDLHWSYNFSQEKDYRDRVGLLDSEIPTDQNQELHPTEATLKTRDTMYGGIRVGIAYQFD